MTSPAIQSEGETAPEASVESSPREDTVGLQELLLDELRDILNAEKQLTKALPKMAEAARFDQLRALFEKHLVETEGQIERINECFSLLGETSRANFVATFLLVDFVTAMNFSNSWSGLG